MICGFMYELNGANATQVKSCQAEKDTEIGISAQSTTSAATTDDTVGGQTLSMREDVIITIRPTQEGRELCSSYPGLINGRTRFLQGADQRRPPVGA